MMINAKHPIREQFAGCSVDGKIVDYYETKGHAICAFDDVLRDHDLRFDYADTQCLYGDEGRKVCDVIPNVTGGFSIADPVGTAVLYWYRMPSGRYEVTGYLA